MKLINSHIQAQVLYGQTAITGPVYPHNSGAWAIFAMGGALPSNEAAVEARFNIKSLADLYNKSLGIVRGVVASVSKNVNVNLTPISQYVPKGISAYGLVGADAMVQLLPNTITEDTASKRDICPLMSVGTTGSLAISPLIEFNFDSPVTITHVKKLTTGAVGGSSLFVVDAQGVETACGVLTVHASDSNVYKLANPLTGTKFRFKMLASLAPLMLLSNVNTAPTAAVAKPTWVVVAHCSTNVYGDTAYSDDILYLADIVDDAGPFTIRGDVVPSAQTQMYCPKIRFNNWSTE